MISEALQLAMDYEKASHDFYHNAGRNIKEPDLVNFIRLLANGKMEHLVQLESACSALTQGQKFSSTGLKSTLPEVVPMPKKTKGCATPDERELALLKQGIQMERESISVYKKVLEGAQDPNIRAIYEYLLAEASEYLKVLSARYRRLTPTAICFKVTNKL